MLFKLLFIVSVLLSTISATEIASNSGHDLSFTEINMITLDELANPELDLENPFRQLDVISAFLYGRIPDPMFIELS